MPGPIAIGIASALAVAMIQGLWRPAERPRWITATLGVLAAGFLAWGVYDLWISPSASDAVPTASAGKNNVTISGSKNTVTIGHIGDVNVPGPELRISAAKARQAPDGTFVAEFDVQVVAPYTPGSLRVEAWAPGIVAFDVSPNRTGISMTGWSGLRPDHAFTTVMQPFGDYTATVMTKEAIDVELRYAFDR